MPIATATATRQGTSSNNADRAAVAVADAGVTAAAVVDIIGHAEDAPQTALLFAETMARVGAQYGGTNGLLSAGALVVDSIAGRGPDGVGVVATTRGTGRTVISWVGDSHAYGWDGERLHRYTTPQTYGQQLRDNGAPWDVAETHDDWLLTSIGRAVPSSIFTVVSPDPVAILATDGLDCVPRERLVEIIREHAGDPQALADALVAEPEVDKDGYRDDVTVVVLAVN